MHGEFSPSSGVDILGKVPCASRVPLGCSEQSLAACGHTHSLLKDPGSSLHTAWVGGRTGMHFGGVSPTLLLVLLFLGALGFLAQPPRLPWHIRKGHLD